MTTITQTLTAPPTAPARTQPPATFVTNADAWVAWVATNVSQTTTLIGQFNTVSGEVNTNATSTTTKAAEAAASAAQAAAASGVVKWVSGTTYAEGAGVWSPLNYQSYRRKSPGAGTTDPSLDVTNWAQIGVTPPPSATVFAYQNFGGF